MALRWHSEAISRGTQRHSEGTQMAIKRTCFLAFSDSSSMAIKR